MARANAKRGQGKVSPKLKAHEAIEMGIAAVEKGDRKDAYGIFKQTSELHPNTSEVWVWLGGTSPDLNAAESAFERAYTIDPDNEEASLGLRWVRLQRKVSLVDIVGAGMAAPTVPERPTYSPSGIEPSAQAVSPSSLQCSNCGKYNNLDEKFCVQCGQDLSKALAAQPYEPGTAGGAEAEESRGGLDTRTIIIAAIMVGVVLLFLAAIIFFFPR